MDRKQFIYSMAAAAGGLSVGFPDRVDHSTSRSGPGRLEDLLSGESPVESAVRVEHGGPRLFVNGVMVAPFFALSTALLTTVENFRKAGIKLLQPIVGLNWGWTGAGTYDWSKIDEYLLELLELHREAFFFPRLHLNTPRWWKKSHPDQMIEYGVAFPEEMYDHTAKASLVRSEGGFFFGSSNELWETSFASRQWLEDTEAMLRNFIQHVETGPLVSRMMGYFLAHGRTAEWNYFGSNYFPDYSQPMQEVCGPVPSVAARMATSYGLLRDPEKEADVMAFYRCLHKVVTGDIVRLAKAVKEETAGRVVCGTFYGYLTESVRIQDAGYLDPMTVLDCADLDIIACPYAYQNTNVEGAERWESDMEDGAGNSLGRARGVGGDGAFRAMVASIRQRGKLFISEVDPSTYLDATDSWRSIGGSGSKTLEGTLSIMRRDLGKFWAEGLGGWLLDFGPLHGVETGWYGDEPIIEEIGRFFGLMAARLDQDISPVAEIAVLCDADSFRATRHWMIEKPWRGFGIRFSDVFNHWFLNAQSRSINRIGAPVDWFHREDFGTLDLTRHKLVIVPNAFLLGQEQVGAIRSFLSGSGLTVVWYYAPGFLTESAIVPSQMEELTGFSFDVLLPPGPLMIDAVDPRDDVEASFGLKSDLEYYPRFSVTNEDAETLGVWKDRSSGVAFARKDMDGWTSVYLGTAPLPVNWLRKLASDAGASLWSSRPDIVSASEDNVMLVATQGGGRTFTLHKALAEVGGPSPGETHELDCEYGEVRLFTARRG